MKRKRSTLRVLIFQTLYEAEFRDISDHEEILDIFKRLMMEEEIDLSETDTMYVKSVLEGVFAQQKDIDAVLTRVAVDWPIDKMTVVDRTILRLGLFEMLFGSRFDVPAKVAINEAIEIAKAFGGATSFSFVNGVLGAVLKEFDVSGERAAESSVEKKNMVGALVFSFKEDTPCFLFIKDMKNKWSLPKGQIKEGENMNTAVGRVVQDEVGVTATTHQEIGKDMYINHTPSGTVRKEVTYFTAKATHSPLQLKESEGLQEVGWFTEEETMSLPMYKSSESLFKSAIRNITADLGTGKSQRWKQYADDLHSVDPSDD